MLPILPDLMDLINLLNKKILLLPVIFIILSRIYLLLKLLIIILLFFCYLPRPYQDKHEFGRISLVYRKIDSASYHDFLFK